MFGEHSTIVGATIMVQAMPSASLAWDAETEEGTPPPFDDIDEGAVTLPLVGSFTAERVVKTIGGTDVPHARLTWNTPPGALTVQVRGKRVADSVWASIAYNEGDTTVDWPMTVIGSNYEFEARHVSFASQGTWLNSTPSTLTASTT